MNIREEGIKLQNLTMCTQYCFRLSGVNKAGHSEFSKEICSHFLDPSKINSFLLEMSTDLIFRTRDCKVGRFGIRVFDQSNCEMELFRI